MIMSWHVPSSGFPDTFRLRYCTGVSLCSVPCPRSSEMNLCHTHVPCPELYEVHNILNLMKNLMKNQHKFPVNFLKLGIIQVMIYILYIYK